MQFFRKAASLLVFSFLFAMGAPAADVAVECDLIETPTSAHDSWSITVWNSRAAFFDNDHYTYATLKDTVETEGGIEYQIFRSDDPNDPFSINLDHPKQLSGEYPLKLIYAELFLGKSKRPELFECKKVKVESIREVFEE